MMANTWQGEFPWQNLLTDGYEGTSPVGLLLRPTGTACYDMTGNVWEWTCDYFTPRHPARPPACCCATQPPGETHRPRGGIAGPGAHLPRKVIKGGSHLCAPSYCLRYRPAARQGETLETATCHLGFRCVIRGGPPAMG